MVNHERQLDDAFAALVDPRRRAIPARPFAIKLPAVMKHLDLLDRAGLITRTQVGRTVTARPRAEPMKAAMDWLQRHQRFWRASLDRLIAYAQAKEAEARETGAREKDA